jgi:hypothetical protein
VLKNFIYAQYECWKQTEVVYSLNHDIMASFPLAVTPKIAKILKERAQRKLTSSRNCGLSFNLKLSKQDNVSLFDLLETVRVSSTVIWLSQPKWSVEESWGQPLRGNLRMMKIHPS